MENEREKERLQLSYFAWQISLPILPQAHPALPQQGNMVSEVKIGCLFVHLLTGLGFAPQNLPTLSKSVMN